MASRRTLLSSASIFKNHLPKKLPDPTASLCSSGPQLLPFFTPSKRLISSIPFTNFTNSTPFLSSHDSEPDVPKRCIFPYENPFLKAGSRTILEVQADEEARRLRVDMPGVAKEGLKIWFENGDLKVEGHGTDEINNMEARKYSFTLEISDHELLNKEEAKAEMKDGVLKLVVPKLKFEERKDVVLVNIA
ncbi:hypothetical protein ACH5RR_038659 [Cinchona calisaya]|uniref:SHSP domain-containing protein n=1 Tax=Cinchona calisaya TaxID=153742 RepID=A0ABD2XVY0_9GENT